MALWTLRALRALFRVLRRPFAPAVGTAPRGAPSAEHWGLVLSALVQWLPSVSLDSGLAAESLHLVALLLPLAQSPPPGLDRLVDAFMLVKDSLPSRAMLAAAAAVLVGADAHTTARVELSKWALKPFTAERAGKGIKTGGGNVQRAVMDVRTYSRPAGRDCRKPHLF